MICVEEISFLFIRLQNKLLYKKVNSMNKQQTTKKYTQQIKSISRVIPNK